MIFLNWRPKQSMATAMDMALGDNRFWYGDFVAKIFCGEQRVPSVKLTMVVGISLNLAQAVLVVSISLVLSSGCFNSSLVE